MVVEEARDKPDHDQHDDRATGVLHDGIEAVGGAEVDANAQDICTGRWSLAARSDMAREALARVHTIAVRTGW